MCFGVTLLELPASILALWQGCAELFNGKSPCAKLLLLSVVLFALALVLRRLLRHVSSGQGLATSCEFPDSGAKIP